MRRTFTTILIPVIIGIIFLLGVLYFISFFNNKGSKPGTVSLESFQENKASFTSKKQAYDAYLKDSTINIRKENLSVNLSALFKSPQDNLTRMNTRQKPANGDSLEKNNASRTKSSAVEYTKTKKKVSAPFPKPQHMSDSTLLLKAPERSRTRESFFSASAEKTNLKPEETLVTIVIHAVVHSRQTVYQGSTVKLRTTSPCIISNRAIPENTFLFGTVGISNDRVTITVSSINVSDELIPVNLTVYDKDGLPGIYIPDLAIHDVSNAGINEAKNRASQINIPYVGNVPMNAIPRSHTSAILTDEYKILLK